MAKSNLELLSKEEANRLIQSCMREAVSYSYGVMTNGIPAFMLKNKDAIIINPDGSVTWKARELGISLHSFIELITGEQQKRRVYIPLCLVNPQSRENLKPLLDSTKNPINGRFNSQEAKIYILTTQGVGFEIRLKLANLTMQYVTLQLMPSDFAMRFASEYCPFCKEAEPK